jgi:diguanylate cyclase (GGDEF)-like protein
MPHLAEHDQLTRLPNRLSFHDRLSEAMARCRRQDARLALILIDLDRLKEINDALGQKVGDRVLQEIGARLRAQLRASDTIARIGADQFALILPDLPDQNAIGLIASKVLASLDQPLRIDASTLHQRASLGIALFPADGEQPDDLLRKAGLASCQAKAAGVRIRLFEGTTRQAGDHRDRLARDLDGALERGELVLEYQPQLDLEHDRVAGFEALLRWQHPTLGRIEPEAFVGLAESGGQIGAIGRWALAQACATAATWPTNQPGPLRVAVNLATAQMAREDLDLVVGRILDDSGLPPERLELELTERCVLDGTERVLAVLPRLHAIGVRLALDDFGTGYASLSHLGGFPLDSLKIDRSFVAGLAGGPGRAIVQCLIELSHRLGLRVIAEGVETEAQLAALRRLGCDEVQGHVLGKPLGADDVVPWLIQQQGQATVVARRSAAT